LVNNFGFMKTVLISNQNIFNSTSPIISEDKVKLRMIARRMNFKNEDDFLKKLKTTAKSNQDLFNKFLQ